MRDILLTGGSGQVGIELRRAAWPADVTLHAPGRDALDLADPASLRHVLAGRRFDAILSCGAYTAVDRAEGEVAAAWAANALAPAILAEAAGRAAIPIVHVSTDYVFPGDASVPYREDDPVGPINVYGASKEGGEQAVRTAAPRHAILRTAWVVSPHRTNFVRTMLRLAGERDEVRVVADQIGCPTSARDLALALRDVALRLLADPGAPTGTFHFVNAGETSWAGLAEVVFAASARQGGPMARVVPIASADYPTPARRPMNSRLSTATIERAYGFEPRRWTQAVEEIVGEIIGASPAAAPVLEPAR